MNNTPQKETNHDSLAKGVLARIEHDAIKPTSKSLFVFKNFSLWGLWGLALILGGLALSVALFSELNSGWESYEITHPNAFIFFIQSFPLLWMFLFAMLLFFGLYTFRKTKTGYRYSLLIIVFSGLVLTIIGGLLFQGGGFGAQTEALLSRFLPYYVPALHMRESFWLQPERGLYSGIVTAIDTERMELSVQSADGATRTFLTDRIPEEQIENITEGGRVHLFATSSESVERLIACHILTPEEGGLKTLADVGGRRQRILDALEKRAGQLIDTDDIPCETIMMPRGRMMR